MPQYLSMTGSLTPPLPPAGWYPDPTSTGQLRYWSGSGWTGSFASPLGDKAPRFTAVRRNIYGNDMLYIEGADGTHIGRANLATGRVVLDQPQYQSDVERVVAEWRAAHTGAQAATAALDASPAPTVVADSGWHDLATNRPGEGVRRKALEVRRKAPVKAFLGRLLGIKTEERSWRVGADGEEEVARRLSRLDSSWKVIHSVVLNEAGTDIDHVVIGPGGVYTLNTKNHLGCTVTVYDRMILVNGQKTDYLRKSRAEGVRASRRLSAACGGPIDAQPVVVVMCSDFRVKGRPSDVYVVGRREIQKWLERRPAVLDADAVDHIYAIARRDSTWLR